MYQLPPRDAIADFVNRHGGASADAIREYMAEMYGMDDDAVNMTLGRLVDAGDLSPRTLGPSLSHRGAPSSRISGYDPAGETFDNDDGL